MEPSNKIWAAFFEPDKFYDQIYRNYYNNIITDFKTSNSEYLLEIGKFYHQDSEHKRWNNKGKKN